jgi:signal transduction histidine kinase
LLSAFVICGLLIGYQLTVTILQVPWIKPATDWLRMALAWPQFLVVAWVSMRLSRAHQPGAISWRLGALAMLSYAVARTTWTIADVFVYPHGVPFPSLPDLFFILQYPCFFMAVILPPAGGRWLPRLRLLVDGLLWMSAFAALSWYFVVAPLFRASGESELSKHISMGYQIGDLVLLYAFTVALTRPRHSTSDQLMMAILSVAFACLFVADTWAAILLFQPPHTYVTGHAPDLFWFTFYLLVPLAGLVKVRLAPRDLPSDLPSGPVAPVERLSWREFRAGALYVLPSIVLVGSGTVIMVHAMLTSTSKSSLFAPVGVGIGLLLLATLRPAVLFIEQEQLRRDREAARAQEAALRLANQRMEEFIGIAGHELKTPLTSLVGSIQLMGRRMDALLHSECTLEDHARAAMVRLRELVGRCDQSIRRIGRLVEDLLDETRIRQGRLEFRLGPCDLASVVDEAVQDQVMLNSERSIRWVAEAHPVPVVADASRIEQVVMNYVSNALKFSREDQPVEVRLYTEEGEARVSVHDEGIGVPVAEQAQVWDCFHQAEGNQVQTGSHVGLGLGLYISKMIIERHHGQVGVESTPDYGTTFWFALPLAHSNLSTTSYRGRSVGTETR